MEVETNQQIRPCNHMKSWVSALADGSLRGFARWFTQLHVKGCPQCGAALRALQRLRERLRGLNAPGSETRMPDDRWETVERKWEELERAHAGQGAG